MPDEIIRYFSGLFAALRAEEIKQKERYDGAIDIEDVAEATAVTVDARAKIQRLRKWLEDLRRMNREIEIAYPPEPQAALEPTETRVMTALRPAGGAASAEVVTVPQFSPIGEAALTERELLIKLCETMILKKPYRFASLAGHVPAAASGRPILSMDEQRTESRQKLSNGLFVDTGGSDDELKARCEHIISACGYGVSQ
jgi:hypothetical protein